MTLPISWNFQSELRYGYLEAFKELAAEMIYSTKISEPGALNYEWFFNAKQSICHINMSYVDLKAGLNHLNIFHEKYADRFYACTKRTGISVYGEINQEIRDVFDKFDTIYLDDFGGFRQSMTLLDSTSDTKKPEQKTKQKCIMYLHTSKG